MKVHVKTMRQAIDGAAMYAAADKSDPFSFRRAMAHIRSGIAFSESGEPLYGAHETSETRVTPTGQEYTATVYRELKHP